MKDKQRTPLTLSCLIVAVVSSWIVMFKRLFTVTSVG